MIERSEHHVAIPPGETIKELMSQRGMSMEDFIKQSDLSEGYIKNLLNGDVRISECAAEKLHDVFGASVSFWLKLDAMYARDLCKVRMENAK